MADSILTQSRLKELLHYDPETGIFTWKVKRKGTDGIGSVAGGLCHKSGYHRIGINYKRYRLHRLAWLYVYGEFPPDHMDHINHDRADNRIINLRCVTNAENHKNMKMRKDNTAGVTGVSWQQNRWVAEIWVDNKKKYLGRFRRKDDAIESRRAAEIKYSFHPNHGQIKGP